LPQASQSGSGVPIGAQNRKHTGSDLPIIIMMMMMMMIVEVVVLPVSTSDANRLVPSNSLITILLKCGSFGFTPIVVVLDTC